MSKTIIEAHPALTIAFSSRSNKLLLAVYDSGYRKGKGPYPTKPNCIGGNPPPGNSPLEVLTKEIKEEYNPHYQRRNPDTNQFGQRVNWANPADILFVREALLKDLEPFQDFLVKATSFGEGTASYTAIYSYFQNEISPEVIECVESNLRRQKTLTPEGLTGVFTLDELLYDSQLSLSTAHITAHALNHRFGINILSPEEIKVEAIGKPKDSFRDYLADFEYSKERQPNHNDPEKTDPSFHDVLFDLQE